MTDTYHRFVARQYGPRAADYVASAVHAGGEDLDRIETIVRDLATAPGGGDRARALQALDLGCGGGHVSYRVAPHVAAVTAVDLSADMLEAVRRNARERGLANVTVRQAAAEHLPFDDACFDALLCRFSVHHWHDFEAGLREARRVLVPGGRAVFVDTVAPAQALLDTHLQAVELLRDATHVRNYGVAEWTTALARAGFTVRETRAYRLRMEFSSWVARTRTPKLHTEAVRSLQTAAPDSVREHFAIEADGSFMLDTELFEVTAG